MIKNRFKILLIAYLFMLAVPAMAQDTTITMHDYRKLTEIADLVMEQKSELEKCQQTNDSLANQKTVVALKLQEYNDLVADLEAQKKGKDATIDSLNAELANLSNIKTNNSKEIDELSRYKKSKKEIRNLEKELETLRIQKLADEDEIKKLETELEQLELKNAENAKKVAENAKQKQIHEEQVKIAQKHENGLKVIRDQLLTRKAELEQSQKDCENVVNNFKEHTANLKKQRESLISSIYADLTQKIPEFVFKTNYDAELCRNYLAQAEKLRVKFLTEDKKKSAQMQKLESDLQSFAKIIDAIQASKNVLNQQYKAADLQNALKLIATAKPAGQNMQDLTNYENLLKNYCQKNNHAHNVLKTAHSFASIGDVEDAKTYINNNLPEYKGYPFLEQAANDKLKNLNKSIQIREEKCSN